MPRDDDVRLDVVRGWITKADADLHTAEIVLGSGPSGPMDTVAYHAQQCAEKCLKALLCSRGHDVPRIHDIEFLLQRTDLRSEVDRPLEEIRMLTDYATVTRYPGDYEPVTHDEAREAVALARHIRAVVRTALPNVRLVE